MGGRTFSTGLPITVSPYYHYNREHYIGGPHDQRVTFDLSMGKEIRENLSVRCSVLICSTTNS